MALEHRPRQRGDVRAHLAEAGVVDDDVDWPFALGNPGHQRLDVGFDGDVGSDERRPHVLGEGSRVRSIGDGHPGTGGAEALRAGQPDARAAAGDDRNLPCQ